MFALLKLNNMNWKEIHEFCCSLENKVHIGMVLFTGRPNVFVH